MSNPGSPENPLRVAIIGAGPSGFYAADQIIKDPDTHAQVDLFDRLPTPYGLVRGGVAPDHPKIKSVTRVYEKTAAKEGFRFFGNVEVGRDVFREVRDHGPRQVRQQFARFAARFQVCPCSGRTDVT